MKEFKGRLEFRRQAGDTESYMSFTLEDESSGVQILSTKVTFEQFMEMITVGREISVTYQVGNLNLIGKTYETENITLFVPNNQKEFLAAAREAAKEYEVDGWSFSDYHLQMNHHNMTYENNPLIRGEKGIYLKTHRFRYV